MPKTEPQSYEVTEYSDPTLDTATAFKVINQIFTERERGPVKNSVWVKWAGDKLKLHYHSYEMFLLHPQRLDRVHDECKQVLDSAVRELKSEFKARTGKALKLSEDKNLADYTIEKVSLNERYYYKAWRLFDVSF